MTSVDQQSFQHSASHFAQSALRAWGDGDRAVALLHAGVALEHLCKSHLCTFHATLVAGSDYDSVLHLSGHGNHAKKAPKTVSGTEAIDRVRRLHADARLRDPQLQIVLDLRNGVAHAGIFPAGQLEAVLASWAAAMRTLLDALGVSWDTFFADQARLAEAIEQQRNAEVVARVAKLLEQARAVAAHIDGLEEREREALIEAAEATAPRRWLKDETEQDVYCPGCGRTGRVWGEVDLEWEADWDIADGEEIFSGMVGTAFFATERFACPVCKLQLDGPEELEAAGEIDLRWELRPATDDEYRDYYTED